MLAVADPVGAGHVASLARPDNSVTGTAAEIAELGGKNLELLKQLLPSASRVAALSLAGNPFSQRFLNNIEAAGRQLEIAIEPVMVGPSKPLADAFETLASNQVDAAVVAPNLPMQPSVELALRHHLPAAAPWRPFAEAGGLLAYTYNGRLMFRQGAAFVDKILKGSKPADLPVEQPTHFELIINLKTAKVLGITLSLAVLTRADEVIE
jgi:putative ABC transport system substrate-binding protein